MFTNKISEEFGLMVDLGSLSEVAYTVFCHPVAWSVKLLIIMKPFQYGETLFA